jgi:hypothetical protein
VTAVPVVDDEHRPLGVVDDAGVAVGMISAVDFVRPLSEDEDGHPRAVARF